ncbi:hypothetical protein MMC08_003927 [Hypocenomyce scalaris]|nr:hypothetical protein [Hypocenomyce scalaris]
MDDKTIPPTESHLEEIGQGNEFSDDVHDPLNWSAPQKLVVLVVTAIWTFLGTTNMIIAGPTLLPISVALNVPTALTTYSIGGPLLAYGIASLIWVAFANRFGIRLTFVGTSLIAGSLCFWGAKATTFGSLVAARTLASVFFASPETLGPQMVGDVFFFKDRSKAVSLLVIMQGSGFAFGPLCGAFIVENLGWRWTQYTMGILALGTCVLLLFLFPETQYTRSTVVNRHHRSVMDNFRFWRVSGGGKPKVHSFPAAFVYPFRYMVHPVVILCTSFFSLYLVTTNYLLTTQSLSYLEVYGFSVDSAGLTNLAPLLGIWAAMLYSGILSDRLVARATRKHGPKPAPEKRLPLLLFSGILGVVGTALFGGCTQAKCPWIASDIGSFGNLFGFVCANGVVYAYFLDVYEARTDAVLVIFNSTKNIAAFCITYAVIPWNASAGYTVPFVVMAAILLFAHLLMLGLYFFGGKLRIWSAKRFIAARDTHHGDAF